MNNLETQPNENPAQIEWEKTPLFSQHVVPQNSNNVVPQISNPSPQNSSNVEPQKAQKLNDEETIPENVKPPTVENTNSAATKNVELRQEKNVAPANLEKPVIRRKSRKKSAKKKTHSQKRKVVPLKFFGLLEEKAGLEIKAKEKGLSLSNYIRMILELPQNMTGRKKANDLKLDKVNDLILDEVVDLDSDIDDAFANLRK